MDRSASDPARASSASARGAHAPTRRTPGRPAAEAGGGVRVERRFSQLGVHPFDAIEWERRDSSITNEKGEVVFTQEDVEVPASWSQLATNVVVSKYFRGLQGSPQRESSVRQLIARVADTIRDWAEAGAYFASPEDLEAFHAELCAILVNQRAAFNSPVWFNLGADPNPQVSACFINSVEDTMASILTLAKTEGMLFKHGSGTGTNLSSIRSSVEHLASGGTASGPVSFMKGFDAFAGVIKSGGTTRRAAKMVILNADHPDIVDFINCKVSEERKAWALIEAGYDGAFTGEAYASVFFQNSNNSIRVTDEFMRAFLEDKEWRTYAVTDKSRVVNTYRARDLMRQIAEAAWACGDPGLQFDTTINEWHTSANSGRINASNPCSEFVFLDDTACNLSSINLLKFLEQDGGFDVDGYRHTVRIMLTAMEVMVGFATYPTEQITRNSHKFRPLGLGYANLGAVLMELGLPYDSPQARDVSGALTAILTGEAYAQSARIAKEVGPFEGYEVNRQPMLRVMEKHRGAAYKISDEYAPPPLLAAARKAWDDAHELGAMHGYRNSQATVLAPTGTISFMLDCDT
ncbi:MAG: vitamin B12-dependent ribonucleotide reductase, partial [Candidatus Dormibacteria bacterium]